MMDMPLGWTFVGLAALYSLGLVPRLRFNPARPGFPTRLAAPVIFAVLAADCFAGFAFSVLLSVGVVGTAVIVTRGKPLVVNASESSR